MAVMPAQKPGRSKQDYQTPPEFIKAVKRKLGIAQFDIDLAASPENAQCSRYYTESDNSLIQPWKVGEGWNWLNPPFGFISPWVARAAMQQELWGAKTAVLVPAGVGSNWWRDHVHRRAWVYFLNGRLTFIGTPINPKTGKPDPYPKDCALLLFDGRHGYSVWNWRE